MNNKFLLLPAAIAAVFSMSAQAAPVTWHDNSYEVLITKDGALATSFIVGDILVGVVGITTYGPGISPVPNSLNAIFATQVTSISSPIGYASCNGGQSSLTSCANIAFGAVNINTGSVGNYLGAVNAAFALVGATAPTIAHVDANTVSTWFNSPASISTSNVMQTTFNSVAPGIPQQVATMDMETAYSNYWTATGPTDLSQVVPLAASTLIGNYGFTNTLAWQAFPLANYATDAQFTANGTIASGGNTTNDPLKFVVWDQANISSTTSNVPEPSALALFGIGLVGAGLYTKKSRRLS